MKDYKALVGFYRLECSDESKDPCRFQRLLDIVLGLPDTEARTVEIDGGGVRLQASKKTAGVTILHFVRIKMDVEPKRARKNGELEPIPLEEDEGLGELTSALYSPSTECLLLVEKNGTVGTGLMGKYFGKLTGGKVYLNEVPTPDVIEWVTKGSSRARRITLRMAVPDRLSPKKYPLIEPSLRAARQLGATKAVLDIKVGKKQGFLNSIVGLVNEGKSLRDENLVESLVAYITDEDDPDIIRPLDIVFDRLVFREPVSASRLGDEQRQRLLLNAWKQWGTFLEQSFRPGVE